MLSLRIFLASLTPHATHYVPSFARFPIFRRSSFRAGGVGCVLFAPWYFHLSYIYICVCVCVCVCVYTYFKKTLFGPLFEIPFIFHHLYIILFLRYPTPDIPHTPVLFLDIANQDTTLPSSVPAIVEREHDSLGYMGYIDGSPENSSVTPPVLKVEAEGKEPACILETSLQS